MRLAEEWKFSWETCKAGKHSHLLWMKKSWLCVEEWTMNLANIKRTKWAHLCVWKCGFGRMCAFPLQKMLHVRDESVISRKGIRDWRDPSFNMEPNVPFCLSMFYKEINYIISYIILYPKVFKKRLFVKKSHKWVISCIWYQWREM